jgi:Na+/H+ antiporter NhaD/arsenite permease-like protein
METIILVVFCIGYLMITVEHQIDVNKTAVALVMGVLCWTLFAIDLFPDEVSHQLLGHLGEISGILFFLMGAMTIVELIDAHDGFQLVNSRITTTGVRQLLWVVGLLTFFLSAALDNLTTTIVMVTLITKLVADQRTRMMVVGLIVICANAGGAWSPIGDVTTTMLWIGGQISALHIISWLIIPSIASAFVPLVVLSFMFKGRLGPLRRDGEGVSINMAASERDQRIVFFAGILALVAVPVFKTLTHLPPFMGMLLALGSLWILIEVLHRGKTREVKQKLSVAYALQRMDTPSVLFFLGILLAVGALQETGQLSTLASWLSERIPNEQVLLSVIGILSAVIDNVPLVAAAMNMYSMEVYPMDHSFWTLLAYCAGTGGSLLIIGSAAGVAAMGLQKVPFLWYVKNVSWIALLGYVAGILVFLGLSAVFSS